jgi:hypothetical protein
MSASLKKKTYLQCVQKELDLHLDQTNLYRRSYRKKPSTKIRRMAKFQQKLADGKRQLANDNRKELQYSSGMSVCRKQHTTIHE